MADCHVLDLTDRGARLELTQRRGIPHTFTLVVEYPALNREVEVIWQSGNQIGVYFLPEETPAEGTRSPSRSKAMSLADLRKIIGA